MNCLSLCVSTLCSASSISTNSKTVNASVSRPVPYYLTSEKYSLAIKLLNNFTRVALDKCVLTVCVYIFMGESVGRKKVCAL